MTRYMVEMAIGSAAIIVFLWFAVSWAAVGAAIAGVFLGFALYRYTLARKIQTTALAAALQIFGQAR